MDDVAEVTRIAGAPRPSTAPLRSTRRPPRARGRPATVVVDRARLRAAARRRPQPGGATRLRGARPGHRVAAGRVGVRRRAGGVVARRPPGGGAARDGVRVGAGPRAVGDAASDLGPAAAARGSRRDDDPRLLAATRPSWSGSTPPPSRTTPSRARWTRRSGERMAESWFDPAGLLLAEDEASCSASTGPSSTTEGRRGVRRRHRSRRAGPRPRQAAHPGRAAPPRRAGCRGGPALRRGRQRAGRRGLLRPRFRPRGGHARAVPRAD